jgi:hypothetical protein
MTLWAGFFKEIGMPINNRKKWVYLIALISLFLSALACRIEGPRIVLEETNETPTPVPTMVITQVVTEIVVPPTNTPSQATQPPVDTPESLATPTWDPLSAPIYYPLPDCVASRLHLQDKAFVSLVGGGNAIRTDTDLRSDTNIVVYAKPGDVLTIISGPVCSDGHIVWFVETQDGWRGYTPEGNGNEYWLFPVGP